MPYCTKCKSDKNSEEFYASHKWCINCIKNYRKARYQCAGCKFSRFTQEQKDQMLELYRQRKTLKEIARQFNCSSTAMGKWIRAMLQPAEIENNEVPAV